MSWGPEGARAAPGRAEACAERMPVAAPGRLLRPSTYALFYARSHVRGLSVKGLFCGVFCVRWVDDCGVGGGVKGLPPFRKRH